MDESDHLAELREKHRRNRELRLEAVRAWAEYVREQPVEVWGPQQNRLVNDQIEAAQKADIDIEHRLRVEAATEDRRPE